MAEHATERSDGRIVGREAGREEGRAADSASVSTKRKHSKRFTAAADGAGVQFIDWARAHGVAACILLALACAAAIATLFWFVVFSDFSASADFIYNQF